MVEEGRVGLLSKSRQGELQKETYASVVRETVKEKLSFDLILLQSCTYTSSDEICCDRSSTLHQPQSNNHAKVSSTSKLALKSRGTMQIQSKKVKEIFLFLPATFIFSKFFQLE